ncbi:hypothetical protein SKAU_G00362000 [Synaphobranchus kaupii]|uniref:Placenta-specific gene 8 protein n=1 Tax=Synaphobranchus kaupii TaxID=118154 RepID=A0A9Q1EIH5_SYNKA|nr:hypothetical protein SKAU_G00362000 [Synaphobranchus kaupii]
MAVTRQPDTYARPEFQTGLFDCFGDCSTCWHGLCCFPCLCCSVASDMDECCMCGINMALRSVYRTRYNIKGSLCSDYLTTAFCLTCSVCQLKRDINKRKQQGIF